MHDIDTTVKGLGDCRHDSPLADLLYIRRSSHHWVDASDRVLLDDDKPLDVIAAGEYRRVSRVLAGLESPGVA